MPAPNHLRLRPETQTDGDFLFELYASTREDLNIAEWTDDQKRNLLQLQFSARQRQYDATYPGADARIVLVDGRAVGRLLVDRTADAIRVVDIALLPAHRRHGIGTAVMRTLLDEAAAARTPVTLRVLADNPARQWYARLGFVATDDVYDVYIEMTWNEKMSSPLTHDAFVTHRYTKFLVHIEVGDTVAVQLTDVSPLQRTAHNEQFTIEFVGPSETFLGQGMRRFEHDQMGHFDLFIVPIARDPGGIRYEAVFNRLI